MLLGTRNLGAYFLAGLLLCAYPIRCEAQSFGDESVPLSATSQSGKSIDRGNIAPVIKESNEALPKPVASSEFYKAGPGSNTFTVERLNAEPEVKADLMQKPTAANPVIVQEPVPAGKAVILDPHKPLPPGPSVSQAPVAPSVKPIGSVIGRKVPTSAAAPSAPTKAANIPPAKRPDFKIVPQRKAAGGFTAPMPESEVSRYTECGSDSDCVLANNGCCDCANGGRTVAVNKIRLADFQNRFSCDHVACTEMARMPECMTELVTCVSHKCKVISSEEIDFSGLKR